MNAKTAGVTVLANIKRCKNLNVQCLISFPYKQYKSLHKDATGCNCNNCSAHSSTIDNDGFGGNKTKKATFDVFDINVHFFQSFYEDILTAIVLSMMLYP